MNEIIIIGCGGHAKSIIDLIESSNEWKIIGLISKENEIKNSLLGYKVFDTDKNLEKISKKYPNAVIGVGQVGLPLKRTKIVNKLKNYNFKLPIIKSKFSFLSKHISIGEGTTLGHGAIVNSNVEIGKYCIINSSSLIEHDSKIGDFCHISTGVIINGNVEIGSGSFIGSGTIIRENIKLPPNTIISAGKRIMGWPIKSN